MPDWGSVREEFPALRNWTYLNTATFGQMPRCAAEAMARHQERRDELGCHDFLSWFDDADGVRASIGRLIGCTAEDVAFLGNASAAVSLLVSSVDWREGDRFVTLPQEFPNHLYQRALFAGKGVAFLEANWEELPAYLDGRTRVVAFSSMNYITGFCPDLADISTRARESGALLYVDGTQGLGGLRFEVRNVKPAIYAVHGYKWLLCPTGAAFMYVDPELRERMRPNVVGWRSHKEWRSVDNLHHGIPEWPSGAERYEGGMLPFPLIYAMGASVELILGLGAAQVEKRVLELAEQVRTVLRRAGANIAGDGLAEYHSPILAAQFSGVDVSALAKELLKRRVVVSARHGYLRVSTHFYNNEEDIQHFERELGSLL